jgi:selenocysteine lyase/cysteine desulfurase
MIDISQVRADTPGCHDLVHFNNAGSSLPTRQSVDAQIEYLRAESRLGGYETKDAYSSQIEDTYQAVAELIGANRSEIALTSNATESLELAVASLWLGEGDRILVAESEYASNVIYYLHLAKMSGVVVEAIPNDDDGQTDAAALASMIDESVKLVSISHMPTNGGLINPAAAIGSVTRDAGIPYMLDACQTVGQLDIDVETIGCDMLAATGRKYLRGPRGTGILYVRQTFRDQVEPPFLDLHGAEWDALESYTPDPTARAFETWEFPYSAVVGLGVATRYALDVGLPNIEHRVIELAAQLRSQLSAVDGVTVRDLGANRGGIVTFTQDGTDSSELSQRLHGAGYNTSYTTPISTLRDAVNRNLSDMVRASVHYFNTTEEIDRVVAAVAAE